MTKTTMTYAIPPETETTLTGTAYGGTLEACLRQAAEQAAEFFGPDTPVTVVITEVRNFAGAVEVYAAEYAARVDTSGGHNVREEEV